MSAITTHVLDTTRGRPAAGIPVTLEFQASAEEWKKVGQGTTDTDGRIKTLVDPAAELTPGVYRLTFNVESYQRAFYPRVVVEFRVENPKEHYHIPLLLGAFGYTTYRGS
jgi:5-hydroxyisourate hydrolase